MFGWFCFKKKEVVAKGYIAENFQLCEHNTEGYHCEQCKRGFYGDAARGTPFDCTPCPCP